MSGESPFPGSQTAIFLAVSSCVGRGSGTLWVLSHEGTIVIYEGLHPADLIISQMSHILILSNQALGFQHEFVGGTHINI